MTRQNAKVLPPQAQAPNLPIIQWGERLLIDARLLHEKLQSKQKFTDWVASRIKDYNLEENKDFLIPENSGAKKDFFASQSYEAKKRGGHNRKDYLLTIDTAKELAMVERNEVGRMIRRYFIQKEKEARGELLTLPNRTAEQIFKGLKPFKVNDRITYPFRKFLLSTGNPRPGGTLYYYVKNYPGHIVDFDNILYISRELAVQIYYTRSLRTVRKANKTMQPVLPLSFADAKPLNPGGSYE